MKWLLVLTVMFVLILIIGCNGNQTSSYRPSDLFYCNKNSDCVFGEINFGPWEISSSGCKNEKYYAEPYVVNVSKPHYMYCRCNKTINECFNSDLSPQTVNVTLSQYYGCFRLIEFDEGPYGLNDEYMTIMNICDEDINMTGWRIIDYHELDLSGENFYAFTTYFSLPDGANFTLYSDCETDTGSGLYWCLDEPVWDSWSDTLYLFDDDMDFVYSYSYDYHLYYPEDFTYCEKDSDCVLDNGARGPEEKPKEVTPGCLNIKYNEQNITLDYGYYYTTCLCNTTINHCYMGQVFR